MELGFFFLAKTICVAGIASSPKPNALAVALETGRLVPTLAS